MLSGIKGGFYTLPLLDKSGEKAPALGLKTLPK